MNRIASVRVQDLSFDPAEAILAVHVRPARLDDDTRIVGRFMGPMCPFATTIEVAYHLRGRLTTSDTITTKAVIPEPSLWEPTTPHLYRLRVELWQGQDLCDMVQISHGLCRLNLGPRGLRVNGNVTKLTGVVASSIREEQALVLRENGVNLLIVKEWEDSLQEVAERLGFFVLLRGEPKSAASIGSMSFLGSVVEQEPGFFLVRREGWDLVGVLHNEESEPQLDSEQIVIGRVIAVDF
jgi:hypothetical protein